MPKRRSGERGAGSGRTAKRRRRHLYLVFDDWLWGYSIRKVDLSSDDSYSDEPPHQHDAAISGDGAERRLPPAVFRVEAQPGDSNCFAAAFGTKIIAMTPTIVDGTPIPATHPLAPRCVVPVFDVRTRLFAFAPRPKMNLFNPIYFSVGEGLFVLSSGSFQLLRPPAALEEPGGDLCWEWRELPKHPFERMNVTSYAVHPDGRTIFVSTSTATFTFDTAKVHRKWRRHGRWTLPFTCRAYFDGELDAWVGLHGDPDEIEGICACDVASSDPGSMDGQRPAWKLGKEKLLSEDPDEEHVGATLVYMGGRSKYCLVQCVSIDDDCADRTRNFYEFMDPESGETGSCRYLLRLTTFSLKFDKHGHLTAGNSRRVRYYRVPQAVTDSALEYPVAFCI
ncbi:uncharacterized protein C2845_PM01G28450 [Panicum miliaceum]|uniref:DUF295 domain-containing protein n=1 Tax=Panicum miliaceum TaxID=4540 RepID=A0A3L6TSB6_PANMI|nr:uncharacterized protein C2845_PM01G28450 [Panicum miliaceum]